MALDSRYITTISLNEVFRDKDTGEPLSGGKIYLYKDNDRGIPKLAYTINTTPPYTYTVLPNPVTLNSYGTLDSPIYWFPYDSTDNDADIELYYAVVTNAAGVTQFTRPAIPDLTDGENPNAVASTITNELSNPQFTEVFIDTQAATTISFSGTSTTTRTIAPDWNLEISHSGAGTLSVARTEILGSQKLPNNPPYVLTITPGANITAVKLVQRLTNNPGIWSPQTSGDMGYIAGSILVSDGVGVTMTYAPSTGTSQDFLNATNSSGSYDELKATFQLAPSDNTDGSDDGYVDIEISLPTSGSAYSVSNLQVVGLDTDQTDVPYDQTTANRNTDRLFNYYKQPFQDKPIPSYLINWDFPFNTVATPTIAASGIGANKSKTIWDNTILFQSVNSGIGVSRASGSGGLVLTAATSAGQAAIVQYLPQAVARKVLNEKIASMISSVTDITAGVTATVSIWRTTDGSLPAISSNLSIVATLDSNGKPATFNGNWTEVPRGTFGDATFTIRTSSTTNFNRNGFVGWDMAGAATVETATWVAIVIGIGTMQVGETVTFDSISLQSGDIPTVPAPNSSSGGLITNQVFTSNSTWTKPNGCSKLDIELVGGGGGGGYGSTGAGVSGAGGGYARKILDVSNITSVSVTVGAGGSAGTNVADGGNGGATSFGSHCAANGGVGGQKYAGTPLDGAVGGVGTTGDLLVRGGGTMAVIAGGVGNASGEGGSSFFGGGARGSLSTGQTGGNYGGGGSGGSNGNNGGAGAAGVVMVTEYYS